MRGGDKWCFEWREEGNPVKLQDISSRMNFIVDTNATHRHMKPITKLADRSHFIAFQLMENNAYNKYCTRLTVMT